MNGYYFRIEPDGGGFLATCRDIPEAITGGETYEEALDMAQDALITAMDFYFEDSRKVPEPSDAKEGEVFVELPPSLLVKVLFLNEMIDQSVKPVELARRLHTSRQEVNRILTLKHPTKIDSMYEAFKAIGKDLCIRVG